MARALADRLMSRISIGDGCWEWQGSVTSAGYGCISRGQRGEGIITTHRASWEIHFGQIPSSAYVCHRCDNRRCVRPDHLFLGSPRDNVQDMIRKGRGNFSRGEAHCYARLTDEQVTEIRRRYEKPRPGLRYGNSRQLADEYGISIAYVTMLAGQKWRRSA